MFLTIVFASFSTFIIRLRLRWVFFYSMKFQFLWWRRGEMAECVSHQTGVSTLCFFFHLRRPYHFVWQRNKGRLSECWTDHVSQRSRITWRWIYARFIWKAKKFKQTIFTFDFGNSGVVWKIFDKIGQTENPELQTEWTTEAMACVCKSTSNSVNVERWTDATVRA